MNKKVTKILTILLAGILMSVMALISAGAADTTAISNTDGVVNVKDYGAKGDGATNDSKAVGKALAASQKNNQTLYFPAGQYNLNNVSFTVNTSLTMAGDPNGSTKLINPGSFYCKNSISVKNFNIVDNSGVFIYMQPTGMRSLKIDNVTYAGDTNSTRFVYCCTNVVGNGLENAEITNCNITNTRYGIQLSCQINSGLISGNNFNLIGNTAVLQSVGAIALGYPNSDKVSAMNVTISDNHISNVAAGYSTKAETRECQGILVYSFGGCVIQNNYLENITGGYDTEGIYCKAVNVKILNNTLINVGDGDGAIVDKKNSPSNDIIISGNTITNNFSSSTSMMKGILVTSQKFTISNNKISMKSGIAFYAAVIDGGVLDGTITNNIIQTYGRTSIYLTRPTGTVTITGNTITQIFQSGEKQDAVINLTGTAASGKITIAQNTISFTNTNLLNMYNTSKDASYDISGNTLITSKEITDSLYGCKSSMLSSIKANNIQTTKPSTIS